MMAKTLSRRAYPLAVVSVIVMVGCGPGEDKWTKGRPKVFKASGTVTLNGEPVSDANVNFISSEETGPGAYGLTDSAGHFRLTTYTQDDGAAAGQYKVTVRKKIVETRPDPNPELNPPKVIKVTYIVPELFGNPDKSGLSASIAGSGQNDISLDLKSP